MMLVADILLAEEGTAIDPEKGRVSSCGTAIAVETVEVFVTRLAVDRWEGGRSTKSNSY